MTNDFITPSKLTVLYVDNSGNTVDTDEYDISSRESFLAHVLRMNREVNRSLEREVYNFAMKLSWSRFYEEGKLTFTDTADSMIYIWEL